MSDKAVITYGLFDSINLAFWDTVRGEYRDYHRNEFRIAKTGEEPYAAHKIGGEHGESPARGREVRAADYQDAEVARRILAGERRREGRAARRGSG